MHKYSSDTDLNWNRSQNHLSKETENITYFQSLRDFIITFSSLPSQVSFEQHSTLAEKKDPIFIQDLFTNGKIHI